MLIGVLMPCFLMVSLGAWAQDVAQPAPGIEEQAKDFIRLEVPGFPFGIVWPESRAWMLRSYREGSSLFLAGSMYLISGVVSRASFEGRRFEAVRFGHRSRLRETFGVGF